MQKKILLEASASFRKKESEKQSSYLKMKEIKKKAFASTVAFIEFHVLNNKEVHRVSHISNHNRVLLSENECDLQTIATHRRNLFLNKINAYFGEKIKTAMHPSK
jgi:hypothetical protein